MNKILNEAQEEQLTALAKYHTAQEVADIMKIKPHTAYNAGDRLGISFKPGRRPKGTKKVYTGTFDKASRIPVVIPDKPKTTIVRVPGVYSNIQSNYLNG